MNPSIREIEAALSLPEFDARAAQLRMAPVPRMSRRPPDKPGEVRLGGVLLLLYCRKQNIHLLLTRRKDDLQSHAGQVSFPGGRNESSESLLATALRETREEVGVSPSALTVLGALTPLYIFPSDFEVHPFVAWYHNEKQPTFSPNDEEVAEIIEVSIEQLLDDATLKQELWTIRGYELQVPFYHVGEHKVWGATAMMLSEFLERLRTMKLRGMLAS